MEAVACERILALEELDPAHCRHDDDGAAHAAVGAGAAADRIEAVAERRLETHRAAMALAGPNVRVAHHVAVSRCCRLYVIPDRETKPVTRPSSIPRERSRSPDGAKRIRATRPCVPRRAKHTNNGSIRSRKDIPFYRNSALAYSSCTSSLSEGRIAIVTKRGMSCGGR